MSDHPSPGHRTDDLQRAVESLRDSEERLRLATEAADMFAWEVDFSTGHIKWAGNAATVIGCPPHHLGSGADSSAFFVHAADRGRINDEFNAALADGRDGFVLDFRGVDGAGGRAFWRSQGRFLRDSRGTALRAVAVTQNVTRQRRAETALQTAAERLHMAELAAGAVIYDFDFASQTFWRGQGLTQVLGWLPDEVAPGEPGWVALRHPEDARRLAFRQHSDYAAADDHYVLEYRVRHKKGHYVWMLDSGRVFRDAAGGVARVAGAAIDISARKSAEVAHSIHANLIELSFEPIIVWHPERGIVDWNKGAEQLYGYARAEALGRNSHELLHSRHPLPLARLMAVLAEFRSWTGEIEQRARDGRRVCVESRHQLVSIDGEELILETNHDITQRKRAESDQARLAAIASAAHDALFGTGIDGRIETWNPAAERLFGHPAADAIGQSIGMLATPAMRGQQFEVLAQVRSGEAVAPFDTRWLRKDGSVVDVSVAAAPVRTPDGTVTAVSVIVHDISERKEWEVRQRMMTRELAHRVKNSFAVLQSILRATLRTSPDPAEFAEVFSGRLHSLAAAQDILSATDWKFAELGTLARYQLSTVGLTEGERLAISGPPVYLAAEHSVPLALIFNELATNAIKHGALSVPAGSIVLSWHVENAGPGGQVLSLVWRERDGPEVAPPVRRGYGSTLIEKSLAGAKVQRLFEAEGLICRIELALTPAGKTAADGAG